MWNFPWRKTLPLALEITPGGLRMMQLATHQGAMRLVASARREFPADQPFSGDLRRDEIKKTLDTGVFITADVIAALPPEMVQLRTLRLPVVGAGEIETLVRRDVDRLFPFDLADADLQCHAAGIVRQGGEERLEVIAAAALKAHIAAYTIELASAGLRIISRRLTPLAALHCAMRDARFASGDKPQEICGAVEIGSMATTVIIAQGGHPLFIKRIERGGRHLNEAVATKLGITLEEAALLRRRAAAGASSANPGDDKVADAIGSAVRGLLERLAGDVELCFRYFAVTFRGRRPGQIALLGDESADLRVQNALNAVLPGKVQVINPLAGIDISTMRSRDRNIAPGEWATCVGLLLGKASGDNSAALSDDLMPRDKDVPIEPSAA
ncbi:MAG TPA: pilus assembly protein PilM [Tepidisphaeraceae bacterium]|jgi:type IV pilus assembly protein PilM|nr:pilus assembly protein PilM [Tepidisphaeraceae bacterium]